MHAGDPPEESHSARSSFIRELVQRSNDSTAPPTVFTEKVPKRIVQYWDDLDRLPEDVGECIDTWQKTEEQGIERLIFDNHKARKFIRQSLGSRHERAYNKCYHPAMQSDYFRLCFIFIEGGCYIDADDIYLGHAIKHLFNDGRLKLQPLCYDTSTHEMVPPSVFTKSGSNASSWIFYFNNNPLIAGCGHPVVERALEAATLALERYMSGELPDIQSTTGPGNLTKSIFDIANKSYDIEAALLVLRDWEEFATSRWPLSYRNDERNWRLSDRNVYLRSKARCMNESQ